jgi:argonaute-like protein implicated in RNA metabolism and viral defense
MYYEDASILKPVETYINKCNERIRLLEDEVAKLKSDHYKDDELKNMQSELKRMRADYYRGFPISEEESQAIVDWKREHDLKKHHLSTPELRMKAEGVSGGRYTYTFIPTSIGISGTIKCSCGAKFEFQQIG